MAPSPVGLASTIVDCTRAEPVFLRVGAISEADVLDVVERARADAIELNAVGPEQIEQADQTEQTEQTEPSEDHEAPDASTAIEQRETTDDD